MRVRCVRVSVYSIHGHFVLQFGYFVLRLDCLLRATAVVLHAECAVLFFAVHQAHILTRLLDMIGVQLESEHQFYLFLDYFKARHSPNNSTKNAANAGARRVATEQMRCNPPRRVSVLQPSPRRAAGVRRSCPWRRCVCGCTRGWR